MKATLLDALDRNLIFPQLNTESIEQLRGVRLGFQGSRLYKTSKVHSHEHDSQ